VSDGWDSTAAMGLVRQGWTHARIAAHYGVTVHAVRWRLKRARSAPRPVESLLNRGRASAWEVTPEARAQTALKLAEASEKRALSECRYRVGAAVRVEFCKGQHVGGIVVGSHWMDVGKCRVIHVRLEDGRLWKADAGRVTKARAAARRSA